MIDISLLTENDKNRLVTYTAVNKTEHGRITSWNNSFIFVDFDNTGRGQACIPKSLEFQHPNQLKQGE